MKYIVAIILRYSQVTKAYHKYIQAILITSHFSIDLKYSQSKIMVPQQIFFNLLFIIVSIVSFFLKCDVYKFERNEI